MSQLSDFDLMDKKTQECPYEYYSLLRKEAPIYKMPGTEYYIVSRYEEILDAIRRPEEFSSEKGFDSFDPPAEVKEIYEKEGFGQPIGTLASCDPPAHTRFRDLVDRAFTAGRVRKMKPYIQSIVDEAIDGFIDDGEAEIVTQFAIPIPLMIIADQLGVPRKDMDKFKIWSDAAVEPIGLMASKERQIECAKLCNEFDHYMYERLEERRKNPSDDILSDLVQARIEGERELNTLELLSITKQLLGAGNETSTSAFAAGVVLMTENPEEMEKCRADRTRYATFAEEVLRLEAPVAGLFRRTTVDTELGGMKFPKGTLLNLRFASANRDEAVFDKPEKLDVCRKAAGKHFSFGQGIHHCIGAQLARRELELGFESLNNRVKNLRLVNEEGLEHAPSFILRSLKEVRVTFDKR